MGGDSTSGTEQGNQQAAGMPGLQRPVAYAAEDSGACGAARVSAQAASSEAEAGPVPSNNLIRRFYDHARRGQFPKLFAKFDG